MIPPPSQQSRPPKCSHHQKTNGFCPMKGIDVPKPVYNVSLLVVGRGLWRLCVCVRRIALSPHSPICSAPQQSIFACFYSKNWRGVEVEGIASRFVGPRSRHVNIAARGSLIPRPSQVLHSQAVKTRIQPIHSAIVRCPPRRTAFGVSVVSLTLLRC